MTKLAIALVLSYKRVHNAALEEAALEVPEEDYLQHRIRALKIGDGE